MDKAAEEGFLGRWSRLKKGAGVEPSPLPTDELLVDAALPETDLGRVPVVVAEGAVAQGAVCEQAPATPLTDADMPDPDSLNESSDFTGFLSEGVSEALRRRALKRLFHLPEFNIRDGLNEYDEDYSTFIPLGDTVTYHMKQWLERQKAEFDQALIEEDVDAEQSTAGVDAGEGVEADESHSLAANAAWDEQGDGLGEADG